MRKIILSALILWTSVLLGQSNILNEENNFKILRSNNQGIQLEIQTQEWSYSRIKEGMQSYFRLIAPGYGTSLEVGAPELPVFKQLIEMPQGAEAKIEILEEEYQDIDLSNSVANQWMFPHQNSVLKVAGAKVDFMIQNKIYQKDAFYSLPLASVQSLGTMRNMFLARLNIAPFAYNPQTQILRVYTKLKVNIQFVDGDWTKTMQLKQKAASNIFNGASQKVINAQSFVVPTQNNDFAETMVIVADTLFRKTLQPFIKMKSRQGFRVIEAYEQDPAVGNTQTSIKNYLQGLYNNASASNPAPTYALFVGDVAQIQPFTAQSLNSMVTDLYFCEYTNDEFPELYYGRFSCEDTIELHNIIYKSLEYEQYLMPQPSYLDTSIIIAGADNNYGPVYGNGQANYAINTYYNTAHSIIGKGYYYPNSSSYAAQIRQEASDGAAFINYTAHGNYNGWADPQFKNSHVASMTNNHKYPLMVGNACLTGKFNSNDCFGEVLTNAANKGAIAYIGASENTYWDEDYYWAVGYKTIVANPSYSASHQAIFDGIFHDHGEGHGQWAQSVAQICQKGNLAVTQSGSKSRYYWEAYHVFGDPSLWHYSFQPDPITPTHNQFIPIGMNNFSVQAVPYALVALSENDSLVASAYCDSLGNATLHFNPWYQPTTALLHIMAQNKQPYHQYLNVITPNGPYIVQYQMSLDDNTGNMNHMADYGEDIQLNLKLVNLTNFPSGMVDMKITSANTNVSISDSTETINLFPGLDTLNFPQAFRFKVDSVVPDQKLVPFQLSIQDSAGNQWNSIIYVSLHAPKFELISISFDDNNGGNGNGIAEAGETLIYDVQIKNAGSIESPAGQADFIPGGTIITGNNNVNFNTLEADSVYHMHFTRGVQSTAVNGKICPISFSINAGGYTLNYDYSQLIGQVDEDFETQDFSKFQWNAVNSNAWQISTIDKFEGNAAARSKNIGNNDTSGLQIYLNVLMDDSISFYRKVSSEKDYDYLEFFIDDQLIDRWSGTKNWEKMTYAVTKGQHHFRWLYVKDYYDLQGSDAAWIDYIIFPATDVFSSIPLDPRSLKKLEIFPNPTQNHFNIFVENETKTHLYAELYSMDGKFIRLLVNEEVMAGKQTYVFDKLGLQKGSYFIRITTDNEQYTKKLIVL